MENDKLTFQHYLVVFLDHLGQRNALRQISDIPTTNEEKADFIEKMKKSVGRVLDTRDSFKTYFESAASYKPTFDLVPSELLEEFAACQKLSISFYGFSDSIIIAVPLKSENDNCTAVNSIYSAFIATCGIGLLSLSLKMPLRAGLDVGVATRIENNEIYGPALERAYYLESNLAEYPRFLVGNELINYLSWVERHEISTRIGLVAKGMASFCKSMIICDTDGRFMLDFLGNKFKEAADDSIKSEFFLSAFEYTLGQYKKYKEEENEKMASRYYRLSQYFHSRKNIWGFKD